MHNLTNSGTVGDQTNGSPVLPAEMLQNAMNCLPGLLAVVSQANLKIILVNSVFVNELGFSNEELTQNNLLFSSLVVENQMERLRHQVNYSLISDKSKKTHVIYRLKNKFGYVASYYLYVAPIYNTDGQFTSYFNFLLQPDLSNWKMPFTSFVTRELFLEQFQNEDFGTFEWLIDLDISYWSPGLYKIYEIDESKTLITRQYVQQFMHPADKDRIRRLTNEALAEDKILDIEFRIITNNYKVKTIHSLARMYKDIDGKPVKFVGSIRDITNQREIEVDLKRKVEELYQSNKELEEFAFVASHDLQEPLRKIITFSSMLKEKFSGALSGDGSMYLSRITNSAENMRALINDLLEFSRITNAHQSFEKTDLNLILRAVKTDLELIIEETGTDILSGHLPTLDAIPTQMKQLFNNIINNAIKFRRKDVRPFITIQAELLDQAQKLEFGLTNGTTYHKITVSDNGIGFESKYSERIFKIFQRLHGKSEYPGSGIGLAICKKIIDYHFGAIFATNNSGSGATFIFIIPENQNSAMHGPGI